MSSCGKNLEIPTNIGNYVCRRTGWAGEELGWDGMGLGGVEVAVVVSRIVEYIRDS